MYANTPAAPDFEKAARTEEAHMLALRVAKCLAATAIDVVTKPQLLAEVKREFAAEIAGRDSHK